MADRRGRWALAPAVMLLCTSCIVDTGPGSATCTAWRFEDGERILSGDNAWFGQIGQGFTTNFSDESGLNGCGGSSMSAFGDGTHDTLSCIVNTEQGQNPAWTAARFDEADLRPTLTITSRDGKLIRGYYSGLALRQDYNYSATPPTGTQRIVYYTLSFKATMSADDAGPGCDETLPPNDEEGGCSAQALRALCAQGDKCSADGGMCSGGGDQIAIPDAPNGQQCRQIATFINESCR